MSSSTTRRPALELPTGLALVEVVTDARPDGDLDAPEAWAFRAIADIDHEIQRETYGHDDMALDARDVLSGMRHQEYQAKRRFVVVRADALRAGGPLPEVTDVVGHVFLSRPVTSNEHLGEVHPFVRPSARGQGVGSVLLSLGEQIVLDAGRTTFLSYAQQGEEPPAGPGAVAATTGAGRVSADAPSTRFALERGYTLEQVERHSVLEMPLEDGLLARFGAESRAAAGPDYRLHTWVDEIPAEWADQVGVLFTRMSTDAPAGGVEYDEDPWDDERVRTMVDRLLGSGHGFLMTAAEHVPTGVLAAFTLFEYPKDQQQFANQEDTLVLSEHRGRRLGMLVKTANLEALVTERPSTRRIHTGNAEENQHMLAINVALGFRPAGGWAAWQKRVGGPESASAARATGHGQADAV
ncbi:GNAT family N-acetyltransferase [Cellulosimicrobium arenosum]|uniref:GNAT family N-acetyltransferase n=1 Tax=Cellulosimicrobium arenosum TaxID=2708133 RepID=A0A927IZP7_9MICO|nr:GNAT family N-acetyltransferase [Cellulosimicrobium arenosum]MBD8078730.1 GNAT family N-acetyltransferase [Cellulosimicrobium arenosum]